jgi:mRNA-degrading endonuclease YafQ of YafQ-DinJ toxin-antitoxin module
MEINTTAYFDRKLFKKIKSRPRLEKKINKQILLLLSNIRHPSLKLHKLTGKRKGQYAFWVEGNLRIVFVSIGDEILLTDILTHDEY